MKRAVKAAILYVLCFCWACIITAVEAVGLDWGD